MKKTVLYCFKSFGPFFNLIHLSKPFETLCYFRFGYMTFCKVHINKITENWPTRAVLILFDFCNAFHTIYHPMDFLPDTQNCGLRMRREFRERFPCQRLQRKPPVGDPGMHHDTCDTNVPWCMPGSLIRGGIPGASATRNYAYLVRGPSDIRDHPLNLL